MVERSTKFTGICIAIYLVYALFLFFMLPVLLPDPVNMSRNLLAKQLSNMSYLQNLSLESGGQPKRSILVTFRGSSALGLLEYLSRQPGCYHHFNPLISYKGQITKLPNIERSLEELHALLHCDYNRSLAMIDDGMKTATFRNFYGVQYKICQTYATDVCSRPETLSRICKIFPFINMSVYNLALRYLQTLLESNDLNVRILLMVRDPRGTMSTRLNREWCISPECALPDDLCRDMVDNYELAQILLKKYPQRFGIVRYEELALNPIQGLNNVFRFYGLPTRSAVEAGNKTEEYQNIHGRFEKPTEWLKVLPVENIIAIQNTCSWAMSLWGYYRISDFHENSKDTFVPLNQLPLFGS